MINLRAMVTLAVAILLSACTTLDDARHGRGTGTAREFAATNEQVWETIPKAINFAGLQLAEDRRAEGYALARRGITAFSWGENVAVFVDRIDATRTRVEVVSLRVAVGNFIAPNWENDILNQIGLLLGQQKS